MIWRYYIFCKNVCIIVLYLMSDDSETYVITVWKTHISDSPAKKIHTPAAPTVLVSLNIALRIDITYILTEVTQNLEKTQQGTPSQPMCYFFIGKKKKWCSHTSTSLRFSGLICFHFACKVLQDIAAWNLGRSRVNRVSILCKKMANLNFLGRHFF